MPGWRDNLSENLTPVQQSMTIDAADYRGVMQLNRLMLGVVIDVFPSDREDGNRSSIQSNVRRGHRHEATVLALNDGAATYMVLDHVVIPPNQPSGLDDYEEKLPKPSSNLTTGDALSGNLNQIDPYDLDGDMCVVAFIGGKIDNPFIISWWPHPRNTFDVATSGAGNPDPRNGEGKALRQSKRYFRRVNGVETVVTSVGDVVISTSRAGSTLNHGGDSTEGRFSRRASERGGNVRVYMKPSKALEWVWDPQKEGIGTLDSTDGELPQTNPPVLSRGPNVVGSDPTESPLPGNTYLYADKNNFRALVPQSFEVISRNEIVGQAEGRINLESVNNIVTVSAGDTVEVFADSMIRLASEDEVRISAGSTALIEGVTSVIIGTTDTEAEEADSPPTGPGVITLDEEGISLGEDSEDFLIKGTSLANALGAVKMTLQALEVVPATNVADASEIIEANTTALIDIITEIENSLSESTKTV